MRPRISIRGCVRQSVRPSVRPSVGPSVTPLLCERFSHHRSCPIACDRCSRVYGTPHRPCPPHYCPCPTARDWCCRDGLVLFERAFLWYLWTDFLKLYMIHKLHSFLYAAKQTTEISIIFLFRSCEWSKVHPFLTDNSNDHHHYFPLREGISLVSVDRFLKIKDHSYTVSFVLFNKIN